jgi:hypothetical protein
MKNGPYELMVAPPGYPGKKYRGRYAYEHTVVWWRNTGEVPPPGYEIHHIDHDHRHNEFSNLQLLTGAEHKRIHSELRSFKAKTAVACGFCGAVRVYKNRVLTSRLWRSKYKKVFCSASCGAKHQHMMAGSSIG